MLRQCKLTTSCLQMVSAILSPCAMPVPFADNSNCFLVIVVSTNEILKLSGLITTSNSVIEESDTFHSCVHVVENERLTIVANGGYVGLQPSHSKIWASFLGNYRVLPLNIYTSGELVVHLLVLLWVSGSVAQVSKLASIRSSFQILQTADPKISS